jgi:hypothetical protein
VFFRHRFPIRGEQQTGFRSVAVVAFDAVAEDQRTLCGEKGADED